MSDVKHIDVPPTDILEELYGTYSQRRDYISDSTVLQQLSQPVPIEQSSWGSGYRTVRAAFQIGYWEDLIGILFSVTTPELLARFSRDQEAVCRDSCVEFFVSNPDDESSYTNYEFNALGTCSAGSGAGRYGRTALSPERMGRIVRAGVTRREEGGLWDWVQLVIVPHGWGEPLQGRVLRGNFYTTGDDLHPPVYQSWSRVVTTKPDFHRPEFFGEIRFL